MKFDVVLRVGSGKKNGRDILGAVASLDVCFSAFEGVSRNLNRKEAFFGEGARLDAELMQCGNQIGCWTLFHPVVSGYDGFSFRAERSIRKKKTQRYAGIACEDSLFWNWQFATVAFNNEIVSFPQDFCAESAQCIGGKKLVFREERVLQYAFPVCKGGNEKRAEGVRLGGRGN